MFFLFATVFPKVVLRAIFREIQRTRVHLNSAKEHSTLRCVERELVHGAYSRSYHSNKLASKFVSLSLAESIISIPLHHPSPFPYRLLPLLADVDMH